MRPLFRTLASGAAALAIVCGALTSVSAAQASTLTPWNNHMVASASVKGQLYSVLFIGSGKHEYEKIKPDGCSYKVAKQYTVSIYKGEVASKVLYHKAFDAQHMFYASEIFNYGTVKYKSTAALISAVKKRATAADEVVAWAIGGKQLAQYRTFALADDINRAEDQLNTYAVGKAKKIAAAQPIDPETGRHDVGEYVGGIALDGYDVAAHMKSTSKLYGSGCNSQDGQAKFERKITVSGTMDYHTLIETDVTDNVTVGIEREPGKARFFRLVAGQRQYFSSVLKATYVFK